MENKFYTQESTLKELAHYNAEYERMIDQYNKKINVISAFIDKEDFIIQEKERIKSQFILPFEFRVEGDFKKGYGINYTEYKKQAYDLLLMGQNPKIIQIITNAKNQHLQQKPESFPFNETEFSEAVFKNLSEGVALLKYEKFLNEEKKKIEKKGAKKPGSFLKMALVIIILIFLSMVWWNVPFFDTLTNYIWIKIGFQFLIIALAIAIINPKQVWIGATVSFIIGFIVLISNAKEIHPIKECEVKITKPSDGGEVGGSAFISGTAVLPPNGHLWIFAHKVGIKDFWIQGDGAVAITAREWNVQVIFGEKGDYGKFEVVGLVVSDETHKYLEHLVGNKKKYPDISLPALADSCAMVILTVNKKDDQDTIQPPLISVINIKKELNRIEKDLVYNQQYPEACRSYLKLYRSIPSRFKTNVSNQEIQSAKDLYDRSNWQESALVMKKNIEIIISN